MKLYGIKNCDTVRKVCKQLDAEGQQYEFIDLKTADLPAEKISMWLEQCPALVNKRSTTYRTIKADWLAAENDSAQQIALIQANPTLIKRPLIEHDDGRVTVGALSWSNPSPYSVCRAWEKPHYRVSSH